MINTEDLEMERRRDEDFVEDLTQMDWAEQLQWQYNRIVEQEAGITSVISKLETIKKLNI